MKNENYHEVKESIAGLVNMLKALLNITIDGLNFQLKYYLCCDYKMNRILLGQKASNSLLGCCWCYKNLRDNPDFNENLIIERNVLMPLEDEREPLIDFIEIKDVVIDILDLFLRITDLLFKLLINKLTTIDGNDGAILENRPNLKVFLEFLRDECKISNPWYISRKGDDSIKLRSLDANERESIFRKIFELYTAEDGERLTKNFYFIFRDLNADFELENYTWLSFYENFIKIKLYDIEPDLRRNLRNLGRAYRELNIRENNAGTLTPYWHATIFHIEEMLDLHGDISIYTNEPNEKLNDFIRIYYKFHSNKNNTNLKYLKQTIQKRNRIEFFHLSGDINELPD